MEKEEILAKMEEGLRWEEEFVLKYNEGIVQELLKTLEKGKYERVMKLLRENISDTERHRKEIKEMLGKLRSGEYEL